MVPGMESDKKEQLEADAAQLQRLGYAQQLLRDMGGFSNFAVSFSIISILTGAVTLYGHGLRFGGPFVMGVGWPLVAVMTLTVAASLGAARVVVPHGGRALPLVRHAGGRAGGLLHGVAQHHRPVRDHRGHRLRPGGVRGGHARVASRAGHVLPLYAAILLSHAVLNHVGVRVVALLNNLSAWYHVAGVAVVIGALVAFAPKQDAAFLLTRFTTEGGQGYPLGYAYGFLIGLLQAQWTFTGYDASAHVSEETCDPTRNAPWGIFLSVAVSARGGLRAAGRRDAGHRRPARRRPPRPIPSCTCCASRSARRLGRALVWITIGAMWFCGLSSVTSNSRMLFAFARDGGLPASAQLKRVSPRFRSPHVAIWVSVAAAFVVAIWSGAYAAMVALSTLALYASYALPVLVGLRARRNGTWAHRGPWDLGRYSTPVNVVALGWCAVVMVLFVLPPNALAGYTFAGALGLLIVYWVAFQRHTFVGPKLARLAPAPVPVTSKE